MIEIEPSRWLRIVQTGLFLRKWSRLGLGDDDLRDLEVEILKGPELHPIIKGTGGVRKIRFARPGAGRGKSGSYRVCYAYFARRGMVFLLTAYGKTEQADLTEAEQTAIAAVVRGIEQSIARGDIR
ncbi:MAG TPA: type II toxin-antitoxin system RelE/ParE family toxin [Isosphaeraceae bacterium]|nr:type II toxin-antitoxin system RelE/ParE family toxin [Isosphaeraceae bacterium]